MDRLAAEGWIEPVETTREGRRPERTVHHAVDAGRAIFNNHLDDLAVVRGVAVMAVLAVIAVVLAARSFNRAVS